MQDINVRDRGKQTTQNRYDIIFKREYNAGQQCYLRRFTEGTKS